MLIRRHDQQGFTLIELMIGIAIVALLLTQALPSFIAWIQNLQIRNSAESILNGLQLARAQAVRSNVNTQIILTDTDPVVGNVDAVVASVNGINWIIRNQAPQDGTLVYKAADFVQGRVGQEGSRNATVAAGQASFVFTPLGRLLNPPAADVDIKVDSVSAYTGKRTMCIIVSPGGQALMCDPNKVDANNPQYCPAIPAHCP